MSEQFVVSLSCTPEGVMRDAVLYAVHSLQDDGVYTDRGTVIEEAVYVFAALCEVNDDYTRELVDARLNGNEDILDESLRKMALIEMEHLIGARELAPVNGHVILGFQASLATLPTEATLNPRFASASPAPILSERTS